MTLRERNRGQTTVSSWLPLLVSKTVVCPQLFIEQDRQVVRGLTPSVTHGNA
jgi:hypothetical protein